MVDWIYLGETGPTGRREPRTVGVAEARSAEARSRSARPAAGRARLPVRVASRSAGERPRVDVDDPVGDVGPDEVAATVQRGIRVGAAENGPAALVIGRAEDGRGIHLDRERPRPVV